MGIMSKLQKILLNRLSPKFTKNQKKKQYSFLADTKQINTSM